VRTFGRVAAGAGVAAAAAVMVGSAFAGATRSVPFRASFIGNAVVKVTGSHADITSAKAVGTGVPIGKATLLGKGAGNSSDPCPLFGGPATITTKTGKIKFTIRPTGGVACTDEEAQMFTLSGRATITGGTGKYARAKGSFKLAGTYNRRSGRFSVKFVGTMTL
jgi:hypothetical protein